MASIPIEISARHVHLTKEDWKVLFGDEEIAVDHEISQHGQFSATQRVELRGPKHAFKSVAVVGPFRPYTQVELSMTDARVLGINAPLVDSGSVGGAVKITIVGTKGGLECAAAIVPKRHIHISPAEADTAGIKDKQMVSVRIGGTRSAKLDNVLVRVHPDFVGRLHLDTDEGNACGVTPSMTAEIIS
jgi:putative phosphotransacetylase